MLDVSARPVNREVFSLAWAEPSVYATGASIIIGRRGPKRLTNSSPHCGMYACMYLCIYIYIYICRVVIVLENYVLVVVNKDRNSIRCQYFWRCVVGLHSVIL